MQMILRDRSFPELAEELRGRKVLIWTCNTCARLCDVGGSSNAQRLATRLRSEGIDVVSVASAKASCITSSAVDQKKTVKQDFDIILALTCDAGSTVGSLVFGRESVNPVLTVGTGYLDDGGRPVVIERDKGITVPLEELAASRSLPVGPF